MHRPVPGAYLQQAEGSGQKHGHSNAPSDRQMVIIKTVNARSIRIASIDTADVRDLREVPVSVKIFVL